MASFLLQCSPSLFNFGTRRPLLRQFLLSNLLKEKKKYSTHRHGTILGAVTECMCPGLDQLEYLGLHLLMLSTSYQFLHLLHECFRSHFIVNQVPAVLNTGLEYQQGIQDNVRVAIGQLFLDGCQCMAWPEKKINKFVTYLLTIEEDSQFCRRKGEFSVKLSKFLNTMVHSALPIYFHTIGT